MNALTEAERTTGGFAVSATLSCAAANTTDSPSLKTELLQPKQILPPQPANVWKFMVWVVSPGFFNGISTNYTGNRICNF